ncbi:hypothetical protein DSECCO2_620120 [anaerobic digester metagenome]
MVCKGTIFIVPVELPVTAIIDGIDGNRDIGCRNNCQILFTCNARTTDIKSKYVIVLRIYKFIVFFGCKNITELYVIGLYLKIESEFNTVKGAVSGKSRQCCITGLVHI